MGCYLLGNFTTMIFVNNVEVGYDRQAVAMPLNGQFRSGSLTAIIGANGAGKSTFLKTLAGLQQAVTGNITFTGGKRPRLAYLPQQAELDRGFPISVFDLVAMGCWPQSGLFGGINRQSAIAVDKALETVGMTEMSHLPVGSLSGGQLQRTLFARLLVQQAPLIMLDEPFTGIDTQTTDLLLKVIAKWHQEGKTVIAVLHDISMVARHFPHVLYLSAQQNLWGSAQDVLGHFPHQAHACITTEPFSLTTGVANS
ncbi:ATP-binding component of an ABC superfamily zinc transporter [Rahnella aquatilis CIP 78.65 = ATCC 33071]|nr:ATP-binding component of an ABC superfamily zinc transporter [Rahnella aquatilis CIP 78.65 = ATCC 33071]